MPKRTSSLLSILAAAAAAFAADVSGPVAGFVFDEAAKAIRPVQGIPGAATLGEPLDFGFPVANASVAPEQDYALAVGTDESVRLVRLESKASQAFETLHGAPQRVVFSPRGASAALVNESTIDVYNGLPGKPALARTLELALIGTPSAVALSDDGAAVLVLASGALRVSGESAEWKTVEPGKWAFAFAPDSRDAVLAGQGGALVRLRDAAGASERKSLADVSGEESAPDAAAVLPEGRIVLARNRQVSILDASGQPVASFTCDCTPARMARMGSVVRLGDVSEAPLWLLDGASAEGRLVFVPPARRARSTEIE